MRPYDKVHQEPLGLPDPVLAAALGVSAEGLTRVRPDLSGEVDLNVDLGILQEGIDEVSRRTGIGEQLGVDRRTDDEPALLPGRGGYGIDFSVGRGRVN